MSRPICNQVAPTGPLASSRFTEMSLNRVMFFSSSQKIPLV